jgi:hypothetical protein
VIPQSLEDSETHSRTTLAALVPAVLLVAPSLNDDVCVYVVGSYGRGEASAEASDFEWITVYDEGRVGNEEARLFQARLTECLASHFGRDRLSVNKTFGEICCIGDLCTNVGGEADTNRTLTYRMLSLAEGQPLVPNLAYDRIVSGLARTYGSSFTAGHRLLSLATDIARYYRTMRIDYKFKVDEGRRPWAVRSMKLRSARRFWYVSSALHFVGFGPRLNYAHDSCFSLDAVSKFMKTMGGNPSRRFATAAVQLSAPPDLVRDVLHCYGQIHTLLADRALRTELDVLDNRYRFGNERYESVHTLCIRLHGQLAELALSVASEPRQQLLEMFLL